MTLPDRAVERLVTGALEGRGDDELFGALCDDLVEGGIPLLRGAVGSQFLHPTMDVRLLRWIRGQGTEGQMLEREPDGGPIDEEWVTSPLYQLVQRQEFLLHRRIDAASIAEFPLLGEFAALGGKDYVALRQPIGRGAMFGEVNEVFASWITDRETGFTPDEVAVFERLQPHLMLALVAVGNVWIARTLLATYLGRDAANRVLAGNIVRGRTDTIRAVIWYSDLRGFTRLTDTLPHAEILALLNDYVEPLVEAVMAEGGEVLKFMGDGLLAVFPIDGDPTSVCDRALAAAELAMAETEILAQKLVALGEAPLRCGLALHLGDVEFGNIGTPTRLDFTVIGPAVNTASRLEGLTKEIGRPVLASASFAAATSAALEPLGEHWLRGIAEPVTVFGLPTPPAARRLVLAELGQPAAR